MEGAFFDLDKTIVAGSSSLALGRSLFQHGLLSRYSLVRSAYAQLTLQLVGTSNKAMDKLRRNAARATTGWEQAKVRQIVGEVLEEVIAPFVYNEAHLLIREHRAAGRLVCIVSSSPAEVVGPVANALGIDRFIATTAETEEGTYTGRLSFWAYGANKAAAVKQLAVESGVELAASYAYSDSFTDLPLLELVGRPAAVNPDRALRRTAVTRGWDVLDFKHPRPGVLRRGASRQLARVAGLAGAAS